MNLNNRLTNLENRVRPIRDAGRIVFVEITRNLSAAEANRRVAAATEAAGAGGMVIEVIEPINS